MGTNFTKPRPGPVCTTYYFISDLFSWHWARIGDEVKNPFLGSLTDIAEDDWEEDEPVRGADEDDAQVHPEVEDLEDLRLGERQHHDTTELGQRDARQHLQT